MSDNQSCKDAFKRSPEKETEIRRESRRQRALERLGVDNPKCIYCDEDDPLVLERHHLGGQAYDGATVIVCRNHHRKLSDRQKDHPEKIGDPPDKLEAIGHFLLGLADLSELLIKKLREFAAVLLDRANTTRDNLPEEP
jgi:hypothetical protein